MAKTFLEELLSSGRLAPGAVTPEPKVTHALNGTIMGKVCDEGITRYIVADGRGGQRFMDAPIQDPKCAGMRNCGTVILQAGDQSSVIDTLPSPSKATLMPEAVKLPEFTIKQINL